MGDNLFKIRLFMFNMKNLILMISVICLINLISASNCPAGIYPCEPDMPFVVAIPTAVSSASTGTCSCPVNESYVPYVNAIDNVNLGNNNLSALGIFLYKNPVGNYYATHLFYGNNTQNMSFISGNNAVGTGFQWGSGGRFICTTGRCIYTPDNDWMDFLNEQGSKYMMTIRLLADIFYINGVEEFRINATGTFVNRTLNVKGNATFLDYICNSTNCYTLEEFLIDTTGGGNPFDQILNTTSNVTFNNITISTLNSSSCDVKSTTSGNLYCGTDATGSGGDGTGGWINDSLNTNTTLNVRANNIYANSLYEPMNDLLSVSLLNRALYNTGGLQIFNWQSGEMYAPSGGLTINIDTRTLLDSSEVTSANWQNRLMSDSTGTTSIDWNNHLLKSGGITMLDWTSFINFGTNSVTCGAITSSSQATLNNLVVNGNTTLKRVVADNITAKNITADKYFGDGSSLTGVNSDSDFNRNNGYTFFEPFLINNAIETGEVGIMGWNYVGQGTGAGASAIVSVQGNHPGQVRLSTGTIASGNATLDLGLGMILDSFAGNMTLEWLFNLSANSTFAQNYTLVMGFADNLNTVVLPVDGIYFMHNTTLINWTAVTSSNSASTFNDTKIRVTGNPWTKMRIELINQSNYQANFYINNVMVASQNTNIPRGTERAFGIMFANRKKSGTTAVTCDFDYVYYKQSFEYSR